VNQGLPGRGLPGASLYNLAQDDLVHRTGLNPGSTHGFPNHQGTKLWGGEGGKSTEKSSDGGADGGEDDRSRGVGHGARLFGSGGK